MRKIILYVLVAVSAQTLLAVATNLNKLRGGASRVEDTDLYHRYATKTLEGKVPYRDFLVEYPPLAIPLFVAPRLITRGIAGYKIAFATEMLLFNAATVWLVAVQVARKEGLSHVPARLAAYTLFFLLMSRFMTSRYDAAPMFFGFAAAVCWFSGREGLGGLAAGIGTLAKIYPILAPMLAVPWEFARTGTRRGRGVLVFSSTLLLGVATWLGVGGWRGVSESLRYQLGRGIEYGSLYSGLQMLCAKAVGAEIVISRDHASFSSVTPWSGRILTLVFPVQAATILWVGVMFVRRGRSEEIRYATAAVLAFVITGKVFSPQFLIWLMPFISVLEGPVAARRRRLFFAGCATALLAPAGLSVLPRTSLWIILAYNLKNFLFLWLLVLLAAGVEPREKSGVFSPGKRLPFA